MAVKNMKVVSPGDKSINKNIQKAILITIILLIIPSAFFPKLTSIAFILLGIMLLLVSGRGKERNKINFYIDISLAILIISLSILNLLDLR